MTKTKRKKLKNMNRKELIAYANSCPGVVLQGKMTKPQIIAAIPWKFQDHDGGEAEKPEEPTLKRPKTEAERLADLEAREAAVAEDEERIASARAGIEKANEPLPKNMTIFEVVRVKNNNVAKSLRKYISMDGYYRYGLTDEQIKEADQLIKEIGCSKPLKREKQPIKSGF